MSLIFAIGDIHGSLRKLQSLMVRCEKFGDGWPARFVFLGDYIDRGPQSAGVIAYLIDLQARLPEQVVTLRGNHEAIALGVIDGTVPADHWLEQGGLETLRSYGVRSAGDLPGAHVNWLRSLPLSHDDGRRFFVHAGIDPDKPFNAQGDTDLFWIREPFLSDQRDHGRLIVHGHTPTSGRKPDLRTNRLNIDTGAVFGGPLTAAVFGEAEIKPIAFVQAD
jgi:serine/threonine protein phosphatase 1